MKKGFDKLSLWYYYILFDENGEYLKDKDALTKEDLKEYIFSYVHMEIKTIKNLKEICEKLRKGD